MFPQKSPFYPLFGPFYPHFAIQSAFQSGRGQPLSATQGKRAATFALVTTVGPQPRPATSIPGESGRVADRQAFASLSYPANRQVLRNPHVGWPGILVSMSMHPRTAVGRGRHAGLLLLRKSAPGRPPLARITPGLSLRRLGWARCAGCWPATPPRSEALGLLGNRAVPGA